MTATAKKLLAALLVASIPTVSFAGTDSDSFTVTATVTNSCDIDANDLAFGSYDPVSSTPLDAATTLTLICTNGAAYDIAMDAGSGAGASVTTRKMTNSGNLLNYSIYRNAGRTNVWGTTSGSNTVTGTGTGSTQTINIYGRIGINQTAPAGGYTDTVIVTVTY